MKIGEIGLGDIAYVKYKVVAKRNGEVAFVLDNMCVGEVTEIGNNYIVVKTVNGNVKILEEFILDLRIYLDLLVGIFETIGKGVSLELVVDSIAISEIRKLKRKLPSNASFKIISKDRIEITKN